MHTLAAEQKYRNFMQFIKVTLTIDFRYKDL